MAYTGRKMVIISHDALVGEDLEILKQTEPFQTLLRDGARVGKLRSIYPTVTYPAHTTLITGVYPEKHGVIANEQYAIGKLGAPWNFFRRANRSKTLFSAAKAAGLTTAAVFWPVTGCDPEIDYLIDEFWPQSPEESIHDAFLRTGTTEAVYKTAVEPNLHLLHPERMTHHPELDRFMAAASAAILETYRPDLLVVHPANVDAARHETGLFTEPVTESLHVVAEITQTLIDAAKRAGTFEQTDFVILSDHGQMNVDRVVNPNVVFAEKGLIQTDAEGRFVDYKAFCQSCGMCSYVYLKNPSNLGVCEEVAALLETMRHDSRFGISEILTREDAMKREHLYGGFSFIIETDGHTTFGNAWMPPYAAPLTNSDYRFGHAPHGYLPDKGPQPVFIGFGASFRPGARVEQATLADCAPTCAAALGLEMPWAQGCVLKDLLA